MNYTQIFEQALYLEYVSGALEDRIFNILKDNGYDCTSNLDEVKEFLITTSRTLKSRDIDEVAEKFFQNNCDRHFLQKIFGKKR